MSLFVLHRGQEFLKFERVLLYFIGRGGWGSFRTFLSGPSQTTRDLSEYGVPPVFPPSKTGTGESLRETVVVGPYWGRRWFRVQDDRGPEGRKTSGRKEGRTGDTRLWCQFRIKTSNPIVNTSNFIWYPWPEGFHCEWKEIDSVEIPYSRTVG